MTDTPSTPPTPEAPPGYHFALDAWGKPVGRPVHADGPPPQPIRQASDGTWELDPNWHRDASGQWQPNLPEPQPTTADATPSETT